MDRSAFRYSLCILIVTEAPGMCLGEVLKVGRQGLVLCRLLFSQHTSYWLVKRQDDFYNFCIDQGEQVYFEKLRNWNICFFVRFFGIFLTMSISLLSAIRFRW